MYGNSWNRLCKYDLKKRTYDHSHHQENSGKTIIDSLSYTFVAQDSTVYFLRHNGFYVYNSQADDFDFYEKYFFTPNSKEVYYISEHPNGKIWIGSEQQLHLFNPTNKSLQPLKKFPDYHLLKGNPLDYTIISMK